MMEQILLSSGSFDGIRETGGFGQPLHALYPQIRAVLAGELGPEMASLLAEPVVDRANNRIDWYTEGDPDHPPVALSNLPEEQRQPILAQVHELLKRGWEVAERYAGSAEARRAQLGAMLRAALGAPAETEIFLVEGRPVVIHWGFVPDRPWETLAGPTQSPAVPLSAPGSLKPPHDVAIPEIAVPELATAATPVSVMANESPPESGRQLESPPPASTSEPASPPSAPEPAPEFPSELASKPSSESTSELSPEIAAPSSPEPESGPGTRWRYVVVGSRYFWSVFAVAVLLAVIAAAWRGLGQSSWSPAPGGKLGPAPDADLEHALTQAQRTEAELRTQLENLLVQLAGRRGQCPSPTAGEGAAPLALKPPGGSRTVPTRSAVAVAAGESPRGPDIKAPLSEGAAVPPTEAPIADRAAISPVTTPSAIDRAAVPPTEAPTADHAMASPVTAPPAKPASHAPTETASPARTLEDVLTDRAPAVAAPPRPPLAQAELPVEADSPARTESPAKIEPPVKAEPTPEERREFVSRLSAAGATTGEITATLLWNSPGDLDLVVRCPSGEQLDYRNPAACGGALDVDANSTRANLSDRPVENAFWPAGRAASGNYQIAVRYTPRKDEQNPRETPFQVRLIRGGQESVFKGAIRPNAVTPITTFTVER